MPRKKPQCTPSYKRIAKPEHQQTVQTPFQILDENNDKRIENGQDSHTKMVRESDCNKYLHKKFKKVATLEETSPGKAKGVLYSIPEEVIRPTSPQSGRHVCHYCKLSCAKPSVLQKHIRAHTNERPYPCLPCGFAFKTKSNLYKHCRSRAHTLKIDGRSSEEEESQPSEVKKIYKPKFHLPELNMSPTSSSSQGSTTPSPSPEYLHNHINKLILDNQAIVDDPIWPKRKFSPSPPLKNGDTRITLVKPISPEPEDLQPLNLTVKETKKRVLTDNFFTRGNQSVIKDMLFKAWENHPDLSKMTEEILHPCPNCKVVFRTLDNLNMHLYSCKPKSSPGPLLGKTQLVESFKDVNVKKRKLDFRLDETRCKSVKLFGGEVQIIDADKSRRESDHFLDSPKKDTQVLTISRTGLNSVGGTILQAERVSSSAIFPEKVVLPLVPNVAPPTLNVPGISTPVQLRFPPTINPLTSITAFNPLTLPPSSLSPLKTTSPYNGGVVTILHAGKAIPFVPGMPGPNSLLANEPLIPKNPETSVIIKQSPTNLKKISKEVTSPKDETKETPISTSTEVGEKKFLRPSSLPLKPGTYTPKREPNTPHAIALVSPETPRPRKSYGQLHLNGHAYTYLGLKCSARMFFCTLNKPQPIYVPLSPDQYKISMYSNWTICSDSSPTPPGLDTRKAMSYYDSRNKMSNYVIANCIKKELMTHSTYHTNRDLRNDVEKTEERTESIQSYATRIKVCEGGFESNEDYIYVRGRGRGRYVCEECGIRCKKPSMLKKHIRTHTDVRPYTCKFCAFSFKTKGNLTKHMKSKAHYKRCVELDIIPVPTSLDDCDLDEEVVKREEERVYSEESEEETDEDDDDSDDSNDGGEGDDCKMEREAARSLLTLSEVTLETAHRQYITAGLISRPRTYPYTLSPTPDEGKRSDKQIEADSWRKDLHMLTKDCSELSILSTSDTYVEASRPMDLICAKTSVITSVGGKVSSLCSTPETPILSEHSEESHLLHSYLTEKSARDKKTEEKTEVKVCLNFTSDHETVITVSNPSKTEPDRVVVMPTMTTVDSPLSECPSSKIVETGKDKKLKAEFFPPSSAPALSYISSTEDGRSMCGVCNKVFNKPSQLRLHVNIHYFERPFRCESCAVSFRTNGHLQKHQRSLSHLNKVNMNSTFGTATSSNPRPFKCDDCKIAFRIHGHLAKHFRSKMHIMKLECLGKLPFGTYAELERSGVNMNDIDTTDCENSLESLQVLAQKLYEKDPSKLSGWDGIEMRRLSESSCGSEEETSTPVTFSCL